MFDYGLRPWSDPVLDAAFQPSTSLFQRAGMVTWLPQQPKTSQKTDHFGLGEVGGFLRTSERLQLLQVSLPSIEEQDFGSVSAYMTFLLIMIIFYMGNCVDHQHFQVGEVDR